jgi:hypothetical protein
MVVLLAGVATLYRLADQRLAVTPAQLTARPA